MPQFNCTVGRSAASFLLALAMTTPLRAQNAPPDAEAQTPSVVTAPVLEGEFEAVVTSTGRYAADPLGSVRVETERYAGELKVGELLVDHGRVSPGQVVLRLEAPDLAEQIDEAREAVARAEQRLGWAEQDLRITEAELAIGAERRGLAMADAEADYKRWQAFGKEDAYTQVRMNMQRQEDRYADSAQELAQLEELYKNARLASRTQDVVLERSRRDLAVSETLIEIARRNFQVQMEVELPRQQRDLDNRMRWTQMEHEHAALRAGTTLEQKVLSVESAKEAVDDAREALAELESDGAALEVKAEQGGVMSAITLRVGDKVQKGQVLATLQSQGRGTIEAQITAEDLRVVQEGDRVEVRWRPFGELTTTGTVRLIAWQGTPGGEDTTRYTMTIAVDEAAPMIRPGMVADLRITRAMENSALSVPADAVGHDEDGAYCMVQTADGFVRRTVIPGAAGDDRIQILDGVKPGESVRVPAE